MQLCTYRYVHVYAYMFTFICVCICVYICIYIYIYSPKTLQLEEPKDPYHHRTPWVENARQATLQKLESRKPARTSSRTLWVAVKILKVSYHNSETILFGIYSSSGSLNQQLMWIVSRWVSPCKLHRRPFTGIARLHEACVCVL